MKARVTERDRMTQTNTDPVLIERAAGACELCTGDRELRGYDVAPHTDGDAAHSVLVCAVCAEQLEGDGPLDATHWFCLQTAAWSEHAPVQVVSWRLLQRLADAGWAQDLAAQIWLPEDVLAWAKAGTTNPADAPPKTVDSNGAELVSGDSVTLIKDLVVKGANFTAKRGTMVKNIRLTDNPEHVDARVNGIAIVLKTCFLKRA